SNIVSTRLDGVEQALVTYPMLSAGAQTVTPGDGFAHLGFVLNFFNPPPCVRGYTRAEQEVKSDGPGEGYRVGSNSSKRGVPEDSYCAEPEGGQIAERGAQNAPYSGTPAAPPQDAAEQRAGSGAEKRT